MWDSGQMRWAQASGEAKAALATDVMRAFCGNPAMPAADLVDCLDRSGGRGFRLHALHGGLHRDRSGPSRGKTCDKSPSRHPLVLIAAQHRALFGDSAATA